MAYKARRYRRDNDNLRQAMRDSLPELLVVLIDKAKAGDMAAIKLVLDRALPPLRPESQAVSIPALLGDNPRQALLEMIATGAIAPDAAASIAAILGAMPSATETVTIEWVG